MDSHQTGQSNLFFGSKENGPKFSSSAFQLSMTSNLEIPFLLEPVRDLRKAPTAAQGAYNLFTGNLVSTAILAVAAIAAVLLFMVALIPIMALIRALSDHDIDMLEKNFRKMRFFGPAFHLLVGTIVQLLLENGIGNSNRKHHDYPLGINVLSLLFLHYRRMQPFEKVVITGSSGFIGTHLRKLLETQSPRLEIITIDKKDALQSHKAGNHGEHSTKFYRMDLSIQPPNISLGDADIVFHLAANPEVRLGHADTNLDYVNNVVATRNLLESLRISRFGGTLVFASTSTVYGEALTIPTPESYGPLLPISMYGASKLACESLISAYAKLFHFNAKIIRFANVVGGESKHGVIFDFANKLEANPKKLEILGDGTQTKSYVYIGDCVNGLVTSASVGDGVDIFNLGTEQTTNVLEIARIVAEEKGLKAVTFGTGYGDGDHGRGWPGDVTKMQLDCNKLIQLGWKYQFTSDEAVRLAAREIESLKRNSNG